jgi:hypothetical protein
LFNFRDLFKHETSQTYVVTALYMVNSYNIAKILVKRVLLLNSGSTSQNGLVFYELSLQKKINIIEKMKNTSNC